LDDSRKERLKILNGYALHSLFWLYLLSTLFLIFFVWQKKDRLLKTSSYLLGFGFLIHTVVIITEFKQNLVGALSCPENTILFLLWSVIFISILCRGKKAYRIPRLFIAGLCCCLIGFVVFGEVLKLKTLELTLFKNTNIMLALHACLCLLSFGFFINAFAFTLGLFIERFSEYSQAEYNLIFFGFLFLALSIGCFATYSILKQGEYWVWSRREAALMVTFFLYLLYLHLKKIPTWERTNAKFVSALGFCSVVMAVSKCL
jgi:hypothetical protein